MILYRGKPCLANALVLGLLLCWGAPKLGTAQEAVQEGLPLPAESGVSTEPLSPAVEAVPAAEFTRRFSQEESRVLRQTLQRAQALQLDDGAPAVELNVQESPPSASLGLLREALLMSNNEEARSRGLDVLSAEGAVRHFELLAAQGAGPLQRQVIAALQRVDGDSLAVLVSDALATGSPEVAAGVEALLPGLAAPLRTVFLTWFREDPVGSFEHLAAAHCLSRMGADEVTEALGGLLWTEDEAAAAIYAEALAALHAPRAETYWLQAVDHPSEGVRQLAIRSLAETGGAQAFAKLHEMALDPGRDPWVQVEALYAMSNWPNLTVIPLYIGVMRDNPQIKRKAAELLAHLTGQYGIGEFFHDWEAWWNAEMGIESAEPVNAPDSGVDPNAPIPGEGLTLEEFMQGTEAEF